MCTGIFKFFCKHAKKRKNEGNKQLFESLYLRNGRQDFLQIWYEFSTGIYARKFGQDIAEV